MAKISKIKPAKRAARSTKSFSAIARLHEKQIIAIRKAIVPLQKLLNRNSVKQVLYSGTMMSQSGAIPVAVIPLRRRRQTLDALLAGPTPYAVLFVGGEVALLRNRVTLTSGAYLLVFGRGRSAWETRILDPRGETITTLSTKEAAFEIARRGEDPKKKAKKLLQKMGIDITLVDIKVEFNGSTKVSVSFLIFDWDLFEDPPLPYL
jgi:hypothetical protein